MIDWDILLAAPYGKPVYTLGSHLERVRYQWLYRTAASQYLNVFEDPADGTLKYRGFAWVASEGAAQVVFGRQGSASIGNADPPPVILLPRPELFSIEEIAEYGLRTEPETFRRYIQLTHHVCFGPFIYHYERMNPAPSERPIAIEVDRDPDIHVRIGSLERGA